MSRLMETPKRHTNCLHFTRTKARTRSFDFPLWLPGWEMSGNQMKKGVGRNRKGALVQACTQLQYSSCLRWGHVKLQVQTSALGVLRVYNCETSASHETCEGASFLKLNSLVLPVWQISSRVSPCCRPINHCPVHCIALLDQQQSTLRASQAVYGGLPFPKRLLTSLQGPTRPWCRQDPRHVSVRCRVASTT